MKARNEQFYIKQAKAFRRLMIQNVLQDITYQIHEYKTYSGDLPFDRGALVDYVDAQIRLIGRIRKDNNALEHRLMAVWYELGQALEDHRAFDLASRCYESAKIYAYDFDQIENINLRILCCRQTQS